MAQRAQEASLLPGQVVGETILRAAVAELVDRTGLPRHTSLVSVVEEPHQPQRR